MLTLRNAGVLLAPVTMAAALLGVAGCGIGPGDHVFYRVATEASKPQASCYQDNMIPASIKDDTSTLRGGSTFILYITGDKAAELDTGSLVLTGAETDTGYKFTGQSVNIEYPVDGVKTTATTDVTVNLTIDGSTITGDSTTVTSSKCEGAACPMNFTAKNCTSTGSFKGVEIDEGQVTVSAGQAANP